MPGSHLVVSHYPYIPLLSDAFLIPLLYRTRGERGNFTTVRNTNQKKAYRNIAYDINTVQSAPGTITDQEIVFRVPFDTIPIVIVSIESSTTNANYGKITAFVDNRSKTGFVIRLANASENNLTPAIAWVAIAK